jgi:hypothetical protein
MLKGYFHYIAVFLQRTENEKLCHIHIGIKIHFRSYILTTKESVLWKEFHNFCKVAEHCIIKSKRRYLLQF